MRDDLGLDFWCKVDVFGGREGRSSHRTDVFEKVAKAKARLLGLCGVVLHWASPKIRSDVRSCRLMPLLSPIIDRLIIQD